MMLVCKLADRALARSAVTGTPVRGPLAWHVSACPRCRAAAASYDELAADVSASLAAPTPSHAFTERVLARIGASEAGCAHLPRVLWLAPALAAALAGLWVLTTPHREAAPAGGDSARARVALSPDTGDPALGDHRNVMRGPYGRSPVTAAQLGAERETPRGTADARRERNQNRGAVLRILLRAKRKIADADRDKRIGVAKSATQGASRQREVATAGAADTKVTWAQWGAYCEMHADYRQAATAYAHASAQSGDPSVGFAAGRAAEAAGDVSAAVLQYSRILSGPAASTGADDDGSGGNGAGNTSSHRDGAVARAST